VRDATDSPRVPEAAQPEQVSADTSAREFRKRPVVVEAMHYAGGGNFHDSGGALPAWLWDAFESETITTSGGLDPIYINTLEGRMEVGVDDWIIRGVQGELYPCKPDIFAATYEPASEASAGVSPLPEVALVGGAVSASDEVIFFGLWQKVPVYHRYGVYDSGTRQDDVEATVCGLPTRNEERKASLATSIPTHHAAKFGRPCLKCFPEAREAWAYKREVESGS
jgi:hypothetical protein